MVKSCLNLVCIIPNTIQLFNKCMKNFFFSPYFVHHKIFYYELLSSYLLYTIQKKKSSSDLFTAIPNICPYEETYDIWRKWQIYKCRNAPVTHQSCTITQKSSTTHAPIIHHICLFSNHINSFWWNSLHEAPL